MASKEDLRVSVELVAAWKNSNPLTVLFPGEDGKLADHIATAITAARAEGEAGMAVAVQLLRELRSVLFVLPQSERTQSLIIRINDVEDNAADPDFLSRREDAVRAETWEKAIMFVNIADIGDAKGADATYKIGKLLEAAAGSKTKVEDEQKNLGR